jgi:hypothetical protein
MRAYAEALRQEIRRQAGRVDDEPPWPGAIEPGAVLVESPDLLRAALALSFRTEGYDLPRAESGPVPVGSSDGIAYVEAGFRLRVTRAKEPTILLMWDDEPIT